MPATCDQTFALRLYTPATGPQGSEPAGVIENVLSGERRAFDGSVALLAALADLQRRASAAPTRPSSPPPAGVP